jgi:hypothetical protein
MKAIDMTHGQRLAAALLMEKQGGSFAGHIARAFYVADSTNAKLLLTAFDGLFCRYYDLHCMNMEYAAQGEDA